MPPPFPGALRPTTSCKLLTPVNYSLAKRHHAKLLSNRMLMATPMKLEYRDEFEKHLDGWKRRFIETSGYGELHQYVNYGNTTSTMKDPPEALYGEPWRLEKLRDLKKRYDPSNVFRWYQPLE